VTVIRCVHHLRDPDGVEDVRQDGFFRLTGEADLGLLGQTLTLSMGYRQGNTTMSPKCLHGGQSKGLIVSNSTRFIVRLVLGDRSNAGALGFDGMETSWRHQPASSLNNECFFPAQDIQSCELGEGSRA
jgi:hypothetical protein